MPSRTAWEGSCGVEGTLRVLTRPPSKITRSVNVPPLGALGHWCAQCSDPGMLDMQLFPSFERFCRSRRQVEMAAALKQRQARCQHRMKEPHHGIAHIVRSFTRNKVTAIEHQNRFQTWHVLFHAAGILDRLTRIVFTMDVQHGHREPAVVNR